MVLQYWRIRGIILQNRYDEMLKYYRQLLTYIKSAVTKNYSEKSINSILDYISTSKQMDLLQVFYETTLDALKVLFWALFFRTCLFLDKAMTKFVIRKEVLIFFKMNWNAFELENACAMVHLPQMHFNCLQWIWSRVICVIFPPVIKGRFSVWNSLLGECLSFVDSVWW